MILLTNEEYVKRLGQLYEKVLSLRDDDNYVINQPQMDKLIEVLNFFLDAAQKCNGKVEPVKLTPRAEHIFPNTPRMAIVPPLTSPSTIPLGQTGAP